MDRYDWKDGNRTESRDELWMSEWDEWLIVRMADAPWMDG